MDQIYYTQCPIGYGLGATSGFQIKRITPGYPLQSDFRHLGLRAYPPGSRTLSPPALRYRDVGGIAEIAWLAPRTHEYDTERGLWGRPGGHFAHGVRLDPLELAAIEGWPAGLFASPIWRTSDLDPTRGRPPDPLTLSSGALLTRPTFLDVIALANDLDADRLAVLLTALARVVRERRTLFVIDLPERLGPRFALLTFLMPLRVELSFSTYHDRPEELPGYRLQGTTAAARTNRSLLLTQGVLADLTTGAVEPRLESSTWAKAIAGWVDRRSSDEWEAFARRLRHAAGRDGFDPWDDASLDGLIRFGSAISLATTSPDWTEDAAMIEFARVFGVQDEWARVRGPEWWLSVEPGSSRARALLKALARWPESWRGDRAEAWGRAVGKWFASASTSERDEAAVAFVSGAVADADRLRFVRSLRESLPDAFWPSIERRLEIAFQSHPRIRTLWSLGSDLSRALHGDSEPLTRLASRWASLFGTNASLIDAVNAELEGRLDAIERIGSLLAPLLDDNETLQAALRGSDLDRATAWLRSFVRRELAGGIDICSRLQFLPEPLRPRFAHVLLVVAADPTLPDETFPHVVERALLTLPEIDRPDSTSWPGLYLDRMASDLDLKARLFVKSTRLPGLHEWINQAWSRQQLSESHRDRLIRVKTMARALSGAVGVDEIDLARVPRIDRPEVLAKILKRDEKTGADASRTLRRCGEAWAESLLTAAAERPTIARAIAESHLLSGDLDPASWIHRLDSIDTCLGMPRGLDALVIASKNQGRRPDPSTWKLRTALLADDARWRSLAEDVRQDLERAIAEEAPDVVERWDKSVSKRIPERFWELVLNVADGPRLGSIVEARAADLKSLPAMSWWDHPRQTDARDDLRDAFARLTPLAPIDETALSDVQNWMRGSTVGAQIKNLDWLSPLGNARWRCIDELSKKIFREGIDDQTRRTNVRDWGENLPLASIEDDELYRFLAWLIHGIKDPSAWDHARLAAQLIKAGLDDPDRVLRWPDELDGLVEIETIEFDDRREIVESLRREILTKRNEARESEAVRRRRELA